MKYRAVTSENFDYIEAKIVAQVMNRNKITNKNELFEYIKENKLIEGSNEKNLRKRFGTIFKRLSSMNNFLIEKLVEESPDIGKFINLFSIVINEKILFDFINEVLREKYLLLDKVIDKSDFIRFMSIKSEQIDKVNNWSDETKKKVSSQMKNYLEESGYLISTEKRMKEMIISKPLIPIDILENIKENYGNEILKALIQNI